MEQVTLFRKHKKGILLPIKVSPKASRDRIGNVVLDAEGKGLLRVWVRAAPEDGKANQAVIQLLAQCFQLKKQQLSIVHGTTDSYKTVLITPLDKVETLETLNTFLQTAMTLPPFLKEGRH